MVTSALRARQRCECETQARERQDKPTLVCLAKGVDTTAQVRHREMHAAQRLIKQQTGPRNHRPDAGAGKSLPTAWRGSVRNFSLEVWEIQRRWCFAWVASRNYCPTNGQLEFLEGTNGTPCPGQGQDNPECGLDPEAYDALRYQVLARHNWHCQSCGASETYRFIISSREAAVGTINFQNLITLLCAWCHESLHHRRQKQG